MSESGNQDHKDAIIYQSYWDRLPFCSKVMLLATVPFAIYGCFHIDYMMILPNHVHFAIFEKQYSRLFTSFIVN